jgi:hypothetical protein
MEKKLIFIGQVDMPLGNGAKQQTKFHKKTTKQAPWK